MRNGVEPIIMAKKKTTKTNVKNTKKNWLKPDNTTKYYNNIIDVIKYQMCTMRTGSTRRDNLCYRFDNNNNSKVKKQNFNCQEKLNTFKGTENKQLECIRPPYNKSKILKPLK